MHYGANSMEWRRMGEFPVFFLGFKSNMFELQSNGWEIAHLYHDYNNAVEFAFKHKSIKLSSYSDPVRLDHDKYIVVNGLGHTVQVVHSNQHDLSSWKSVSPDMMRAPIQDLMKYNIEDIPCFQSDDTLFDKADWEVIDHLEAVKNLQKEKQKELRKKVNNTVNQKHNVLKLIAV